MVKTKSKGVYWIIMLVLVILYNIAVIWNIRIGGNYNLEIAHGSLILVIVFLIGTIKDYFE